jgi:glycosyltransferase involved in cell wall biosynthesis
VGYWADIAAYSSAAITAFWVLATFLRPFELRGIIRFEELDTAPPRPSPRLSIVVAARNEETTIGAALSTLLAQDYDDFEVVIVDDRSTDATGDVIAALARHEPRLIPLTIGTLPDGWLGKVHALEVATRRATGDFILFTDADVHFAPGALRRAVAAMDRETLDHLAVIPHFVTHSWLLDSMVTAFGIIFLHTARAGRIAEGGGFAGVGAFNLVRRDALARTPGFEWLKMEICDDVGLAYMLHLAQARARLAMSRSDIAMHWYNTVGEMIAGLEKNLFAVGAGYKLHRGVSAAIALVFIALGPWLSLLQTTYSWAWVCGPLAILASWMMALRMRPLWNTRVLGPSLPSVGLLLIAAAMIRSMYATLKRRGIVWRGTHYPLAALRAGRRVPW